MPVAAGHRLHNVVGTGGIRNRLDQCRCPDLAPTSQRLLFFYSSCLASSVGRLATGLPFLSIYLLTSPYPSFSWVGNSVAGAPVATSTQLGLPREATSSCHTLVLGSRIHRLGQYVASGISDFELSTLEVRSGLTELQLQSA